MKITNKAIQIITLLSAIFLVSCSGQANPLVQCEGAIAKLFADQKSAFSQACLGSSSQGFNNLGDMDRCLNQTDTNFISLYINNNFNNIYPTPYVLCLPDVCTSSLIGSNTAAFNAILNQYISKIPFITQQVEITSVYDSTNDTPSVNAGVVIVSIIIAVLIISSISGSFIAYSHESAKENAIKKRIQLQQQSNDNNTEPPSRANLSNDNDEYPLPEETTFHKVGKSLGFVENFTKLFSFKSHGHIDFAIYNGTRVFLIVWIIVGQSYLIRFGSIKNVADKTTIETTAGYSTIAATSQLAVDLFFYISGFLLAAITLERFANRTELKVTDLLTFIFHRLIRLWPTYFIAILFYWQIWQFSGDGPMWNQYVDKIDACNSRVWANILMIDNLANNGNTEGCFEWGFVIANEIQFFVIGIILLYIYSLNSKVGLSLILAFFVGSQVASIVIAQNNDYVADYFTLTNPDTFYNDYHIKPWVKMGTYFLGVLAGIFYRNYKTGSSGVVQFADKVLNNTVLRYILYFAGIGLISSMVWCIIPVQDDVTNWSQGGHSTYLAFGKVGFVLGYFLLTLPLLFGKRNMIRGILGSRFWVPLSRVSFCIYLVHQFMIERSLFNQRNLRYFDNQLAFYSAISDTIFSLLMGAAFCVLVELPITNLEKLFINSPSKLKGIAQDDSEDFEAIEIKKQMMSN